MSTAWLKECSPRRAPCTIMQLCVMLKHDADRRSRYTTRCLMWACMPSEHPPFISRLTALFASLQARSFVSVERFVSEVINQRAARGQTPLMLACANG